MRTKDKNPIYNHHVDSLNALVNPVCHGDRILLDRGDTLGYRIVECTVDIKGKWRISGDVEVSGIDGQVQLIRVLDQLANGIFPIG
jgi:hypothetical protein